MINFFRRIRRKLADDNKPLKYFRYAIGEIVLVVLGILIALQINNWNEERKSKILGNNYTKLVYKDLQNDIFKIEGILKILHNQYEAGIEVLTIIDAEKPGTYDTIRLNNNINWVLTTGVFTERGENTWDGLKISGDQAIIRNDSLTVLLNAFYSHFDRLIENFNELPKKARLELREVSSQCHNKENLQGYYENGLENYTANRDELDCILRIKDLSNMVRSVTISSIANLENFKYLNNEGKSVISYLDENLYGIIH